MESCHTFGMSVFLWKVLPALSIVEASIIFSSMGVVPAILNIFGDRRGTRAKIIVLLVLDVIACVLQVAGLVGLTALLYKKYGRYSGWECVCI